MTSPTASAATVGSIDPGGGASTRDGRPCSPWPTCVTATPTWASPALPGAVHDLTAARTHGIIEALTSADAMPLADKGYQGARGSVRTPFKQRRFRPKLSRRQKAVNRAYAKIRARGERAIATLKTWKILAKLRCRPRRTAIVQTILVLHDIESKCCTG